MDLPEMIDAKHWQKSFQLSILGTVLGILKLYGFFFLGAT